MRNPILNKQEPCMEKKAGFKRIRSQAFKPGEVTPEQCNQLGLELAEK